MTTRTFGRALLVAALTALSCSAAASTAAANVPLRRVSADPFANATSQHATEVEPDTFAAGRTVVSAFQVGRFFNGGATDIGFARSGDGGATWGAPGFLAGTTSSAGFPTPFERVSDASVAFDSAHGVWLISSIPILPNTAVPTVFVHRSTDDGRTFDPKPVQLPPPASNSVNLDKNWTVCDNTRTSPFFGHCYTELDNFGDGDLELMSTSTDGGLTWSTPIPTAGHANGLGGPPLVQPNGTVIVPFEALNGKISAFRSADGGASWTRAVNISAIRFHSVAGDLRTSPLPTAEIDGAGNVFVAWEDCRFRRLCSSNDNVFSRSGDGVRGTDAARVPIDDVTSTVDHFIPGLAVDPASSGAGAHLALTYYFYPTANCGGACRLAVGYISSPDAGAHWSAPQQLAGPMALSEIANTSQGPMVGDYISTSFAGARATSVFAVGLRQPTTTSFDEAMYAPTTPLAVATPQTATRPSSTAGVVTPVTGVGTGAALRALKGDCPAPACRGARGRRGGRRVVVAETRRGSIGRCGGRPARPPHPAPRSGRAVVRVACELALVHVLGVGRLLRQRRVVLVGVADLLLEALVARDVVGAGDAPRVVRHVALLPVAWLSRTSPDRAALMRRSVVGGKRLRRRLLEVDRVDPDVVDRAVAAVGLRRADPVDDVHPVAHLAEDRVLAFEPRRGLGGDDEELRAVRVRPGVRHREGALDDLVR